MKTKIKDGLVLLIAMLLFSTAHSQTYRDAVLVSTVSRAPLAPSLQKINQIEFEKLWPSGSGGVFLSTNNGTSWTAVNTGLTNTFVRALAVSPNGAGGTNLLAGTHGGVFLSTNYGTSWTAVNTVLTNTFVFALAVSGINLFAGTLVSWPNV